MSASFEINSSTGAYQVRIQSNGFAEFVRQFPQASIIADEFFIPALSALNTSATFVEASEANKSLDASPAIIEKLRKSGANRQTELVAVGGGILQDLSAFIASVYMRGLTWSYLPTTVLGMVDSCIGGKSSINVGPYKNLVGTFHPPRQVLIDPALARTLPDDQKASGLIEAAKICFCRGSEAFDRYMSCGPSTAINTDALESLIVNSLEAKKWFIEIDEFDQKERLLLNFGHTFGHAIEGACQYAISHGIAVGLGILCALTFERAQGVNYSSNPRVQQLEHHLRELITFAPGLSVALQAMPLDDVLERFASDKKHTPTHFTLILVALQGDVILRRIPKSPSVTLAVRDAIEVVVERFAS